MLPVLLVCPVIAQEPGSAETSKSTERPAAVREVVIKRIVVDRFRGHASAAVPRAGVIALLEQEESIDLVSVRELEAESRLVDGTPEGYVEVATKLDVVAILRGFIARADAGYSATITVINGRDGHRQGKFDYYAETLGKLRKVLRRELWLDLEPLLERDRPVERRPEETPGITSASQASPEPQPAHDGKTPASTPSLPDPISEGVPAEAAARRKALIQSRRASASAPAETCRGAELELYGGALWRHFDYEREERGALRGYTLRGGPNAGMALALYPAALVGCGLPAGLGASVELEHLGPVESRLADRELSTNASAQRAQLLYRIRLGRFEPGISAGYVARRFFVSDAVIPELDLQSVRFGVDLEIHLSLFLIELGMGGLRVIDTGELGSEPWFPQLSQAYGYDAEAALGVRPLSWLDVLVRGRLESYHLDFDTGPPLPPGAHGVAAGARDDYLSFELLLRVALMR